MDSDSSLNDTKHVKSIFKYTVVLFLHTTPQKKKKADSSLSD